ncbi:tRNA (guanosine(37)-N1)-methyltransferase TrmD [Candidatus Uhrbacteria bacterium]|nr:tRNA (guanosine(37)-N1)-methyltransferase TrmD [Candidatus Uhrbacteria bacterium]
MKRIDLITLFPDAVQPYINSSILHRAQTQRRMRFGIHQLRDWGVGQRRTVDDRPYGGGAGMVLQVGPFFRALRKLRAIDAQGKRTSRSTRILLTSAKGTLFTQRDAERYQQKFDRLIILCGHYEGVDERVAQHLADEEVSIGPYVLTGGELPALIIADAVTRLIPGVLGNAESPIEESFKLQTASQRGDAPHSDLPLEAWSLPREHPQYTRPEIFLPNPKRPRIAWRVPDVLLSGDHAKIAAWRAAQQSSLKRIKTSCTIPVTSTN